MIRFTYKIDHEFSHVYLWNVYLFIDTPLSYIATSAARATCVTYAGIKVLTKDDTNRKLNNIIFIFLCNEFLLSSIPVNFGEVFQQYHAEKRRQLQIYGNDIF